MKILVSLFHAKGNKTLCLLDEELKLINFFGYKNIQNTKGLFLYENKVFAAHKDSNDRCSISVYSKENLAILSNTSISKTKDIHSILVKDEQLWAVSTGTNEVHVYELKDFVNKKENTFPIKSIKPFNKTDTEKDMVHLNSITQTSRDILISGFGMKEKKGEKWLNQTEGFIYSLSLKTFLPSFMKINHPHSIFVDNKDTYVCESGENSIIKNGKYLIQKLNGYPRGFLVSKEKSFFIGLSKRFYSLSEDKTRIIKYNQNNDSYKKEFEYIFDEDSVEIYDLIFIK